MSEFGPKGYGFSMSEGAHQVDEQAVVESQQMLNILREERRVMSEQQGVIIPLGMLRGETPQEHWTGSISLKSRLDSGEISQTEVDGTGDRLAGGFVPVGIGAPKRCVDGRTIQGFDIDDVNWLNRQLGVQLPGGTIGDATGIRLAKGYEPGATLIGDVEDTVQNHESQFAPGDHIDDHAVGEKTGCGAVDGQVRKAELEADNERFETLTQIMSSVYNKAGLDLPQGFFVKLKESAQSLKDNASDYYSNKEKTIDVIREDNPKGVEPLVGPHKEISLTLNFVNGTTFDRDAYNNLTDNKLQNFNLDVWAIIEEHGENAAFVLADAIATVLDLTDGSLLLFARLPQDTSEPEKSIA